MVQSIISAFPIGSSADPVLGTLTGISVGPGDPDLITLKALKALEAVDVVAFPKGRKGYPGLAQQIIAQRLHPDQQQLPLNFPFVTDPEILQQAWSQAAKAVWQVLNQGRHVGFVCEGDISFYSTFTYLAQTLQTEHPEVQIHRIPGVCSPLAAVNALGVPLTMQSDRLAILPAFYGIADLERTLHWAEVIVLMKVSSVYPQVWALLQRHNLLKNSWVVVRASQPDEIIYRDLSRHPHLSLPYFSLMVIRSDSNSLL